MVLYINIDNKMMVFIMIIVKHFPFKKIWVLFFDGHFNAVKFCVFLLQIRILKVWIIFFCMFPIRDYLNDAGISISEFE